MPTVKIGPAIDEKIYKELRRVARENGQSQRFVLERAIEHYVQVVVPSQRTIRPDIMTHFRRSTDKNRQLHELLAK